MPAPPPDPVPRTIASIFSAVAVCVSRRSVVPRPSTFPGMGTPEEPGCPPEGGGPDVLTEVDETPNWCARVSLVLVVVVPLVVIACQFNHMNALLKDFTVWMDQHVVEGTAARCSDVCGRVMWWSTCHVATPPPPASSTDRQIAGPNNRTVQRCPGSKQIRAWRDWGGGTTTSTTPNMPTTRRH